MTPETIDRLLLGKSKDAVREGTLAFCRPQAPLNSELAPFLFVFFICSR